MKTPPWLILDCDNLLRRAFYASGPSPIYIFLRQVLKLQALFQTDKIVFCFDCGKSLRCKILPEYKRRRRDRLEGETAADKLARLAFNHEVVNLQTVHLLNIGYRNVFYEHGYEADDLIASVCSSLPKNSSAVVVSSDKDMYQLISKKPFIKVGIGDEFFGPSWFELAQGIAPQVWHTVKEIAGCVSDDIPGVGGVGEATAIKYLRGELSPTTKAYKTIHSREGRKTIKRNLMLTKLPFRGTPIRKLRKDRITTASWNKVMKQLGFKTLLRKR